MTPPIPLPAAPRSRTDRRRRGRRVVTAAAIVLALGACTPEVPAVIEQATGGGSSTATAPPATTAPARPGAGHRLDVPASIDATGRHDVTDALNALFASVGPNTVVQFPAGGQYRVDGTVTLLNRAHVVVEGNGSRFVAKTDGAQNRMHWRIQDSTDVTVRGVTVVGANPKAGVALEAYRSDKEAQHGFGIYGGDGVELDHVSVSDVYGDFVYLGMSQLSNSWASNVWIHDSRFERNGRQGFGVVAARHVRIERNYVGDVRWDVVDVEPNATRWGADDVVFTNNDVGPGRLMFVAVNGVGPVSNIEISNNRLTGRAMQMGINAPTPEHRHGLVISGNRTSAVYTADERAPISVYRWDDVRVEGNTAPLRAGRNMFGVRVTDSCRTTVRNNTFAGAVAESRHFGTTC